MLSAYSTICKYMYARHNYSIIVQHCMLRTMYAPPGSMVTSICWNDGANILAAMQDNHFVVWYHPGIVHADKDLLPLTLFTKEGR